MAVFEVVGGLPPSVIEVAGWGLSPQPMPIEDMTYLPPPTPAPSNGRLSGSFPDGITRVDGVPAPATIRVLYRPLSGQLGDGVVVAETVSAEDGTWQVNGLDPLLKYDVICRKDGFNDMILANVSPLPI